MSRLLCVLLGLLALACDPPQQGVQLTVRAAQDPSCQPTDVLRVELQPLADTPVAARMAQSLDLRADTGRQDLPQPFPPETVGVRVRAQARDAWDGGAIVFLDPERPELVAPMLPFFRACALTDPELVMRVGAAVATLPDGRLVLAGGDTESFASDAVVVVTPGAPLAELEAARLDRERTRATATWTSGATLLVAGGTVDAGRAVRETFLLLDVDTGEAESGTLTVPRYDHAATRLEDGSVLLVGGRSEGPGETGDPIAEVERVILGEDGPLAERAGTTTARAGPSVLVLDDGEVLIVGGVDRDGQPVGAIERWVDGAVQGIGAWDARADAAYVALAGARHAMVGGRNGAGDWTGRVLVRLPGGAEVAFDDALPPLEAPRALGLPDGRILVVGAEPGTTNRRAALFDPGGTRTSSALLTATRSNAVPAAVVRLADGSIALADDGGVDLLRVDLASSFDEPPGAIDPGQVAQREGLSLDAAPRWTTEPPAGLARGPLYAAADDARLDLPTARFSALSLELDMVGPGAILLTRPGRPPHVIEVDDDTIAFGDCALERASGADPVGVLRASGTLTLRVGEATTDCELEGSERLGVAVRLARDSGIGRLSASR